MNNVGDVLKYIMIGVNILLTIFFAGSYYIMIGIFMAALSIVTIILLKDHAIGHWVIRSQIKSYDVDLLVSKKKSNPLLVSIAFLIISIKLGAGIALFVEGAAVVLIAFCILIACGWLFSGSASGMSVGLAYNISKLVVKVYLFFSSLVDKLAMQLVKIEFAMLKIEQN